MKNIYTGIIASIAAFSFFSSSAHASNFGDYAGGVAIGGSYAGTTAPTNGLMIQGNVGIGTTSPDVSLSLTGQSSQTIDMVRETTASTAGNSLTIQAGGSVSGGTNLNGGNLILSSGISTGTGASNAQFQIYPAGSSGTSDTTALTALTVSATGTTGSNATTTLQANAGSGTNKNGGNLVLSSGVPTSTGVSDIYFNVYNAGSSGSTPNSPTTAMYITPGGLLTIGTTTTNLDINLSKSSVGSNVGISIQNRDNTNSASSAVLQLQVGGNSAGSPYIDFGGPSITQALIGLDRGDSYKLKVSNAFGTTDWIVVNTSNGNVGIGQSSPSQKLDVNGSIHVGTFAAASSTTVCQNGGTLSSCSSAMRFKNNVKPSELGLKDVLAMKPVTFDFKDHKENWEKHDFGFIAEDMEKINPVFVTYDDKGKISGVRYMQLTAVNAKAIQELHDEIDKLKREIEQLKQKK